MAHLSEVQYQNLSGRSTPKVSSIMTKPPAMEHEDSPSNVYSAGRDAMPHGVGVWHTDCISNVDGQQDRITSLEFFP